MYYTEIFVFECMSTFKKYRIYHKYSDTSTTSDLNKSILLLVSASTNWWIVGKRCKPCSVYASLFPLTFSALQTNTDQHSYLSKQCRSWWDGSSWAISSGSTLFAIMLLTTDCNLYLKQWKCPFFKNGRVHSKNSGVIGLRYTWHYENMPI